MSTTISHLTDCFLWIITPGINILTRVNSSTTTIQKRGVSVVIQTSQPI